MYPRSVDVAFDRKLWLGACDAKGKLEGGVLRDRARLSSQRSVDVTGSARSATR
jgi:hypothetical protein